MSNSNDVKPVVWMGDSLKQVKSFPEEVRRDVGSSLYDAQLGDKPNNAKPFKGVGRGIFEIVTRFDTDTYRTVYAVQIGDCIYVLHAFQKKSPKGIKTAQQDVDLIKKRYQAATIAIKRELIMNEETTPVEFVKSSGNVFADMGLEDAEELLTRAKLGAAVRRIIESRHLTQQKIAQVLDIKQPEVSNIMKGKYHLFSEARLFGFLNRLERKVTIQISTHHAGEAFIDVAVES